LDYIQTNNLTTKKMAEYLLIFRGGDAQTAQQSPEKWQAHMQKWMQWMGDLKEQGKLVGAQPLATTGKMVSGTKKVVSDGPYMEGKEMVGGYLLCTAASYDEAVEISMACPILEHDGVVEVREIKAITM
jgi:hypothetical protein